MGERHRVLGLCIVLAWAGHAAAAPRAELWPLWDASDAGSTRRIDHQAWQGLLDRYLTTTGDGRTLFRYHAVDAAARRTLDDYLQRLEREDPRELSEPEQLAYWINLYNALTVRVVLDHPDSDSIRDMGGGFFSRGPWDEPLARIAGEPVTLNDIEHRILRPIWRDHRLHFALNCASLGCPNLAPEAFTADHAERLLQQGERNYLLHPRGVSLEDDRLVLSSLFDWYVADFGGSRQALLDYLAGARPDIGSTLHAYDGRIRYRYDWALNAAR